MLAAEELKISNAKRIFGTIFQAITIVATQSEIALKWQSKGFERAFLLAREGTNQKYLLSKNLINSSK